MGLTSCWAVILISNVEAGISKGKTNAARDFEVSETAYP